MKIVGRSNNSLETKSNHRLRKLNPLLESLTILGTSEVIFLNSLHRRVLEDELFLLISFNKNKILEVAKSNKDNLFAFELIDSFSDYNNKILFFYEKKVENNSQQENIYLSKPSFNLAVKINISIDETFNQLKIPRDNHGYMMLEILTKT